MVYGAYDLILEEHPRIYAFTRTLDNDRLLVLLNFSGESSRFTAPEELEMTGAELLIGNYPPLADRDKAARPAQASTPEEGRRAFCERQRLHGIGFAIVEEIKDPSEKT